MPGICRRSFMIAAAAGLPFCAAAFAQPDSSLSRDVTFKADSGALRDRGSGPALGVEPVLAWSQVVTIPAVPWLRVQFGADTKLAGPDRHRGGSYLVITSVADWAKHYLDAATLPEWNRISAMMNGETVFVELYTVPGAGDNRVTIENVIAGQTPGGPDNPCGGADDRVPDNDPRLGRMTVGCTGWLISENGTANEFLSAGHCISNGQTGVLVHFNVPAASAAGAYIAPPPEFQFPIQSASIQSFQGAALADDYCRFSTSNNSNTGLSARVAQGRGAFTLANAAPASGSAATTIRGHGIVNAQAGIPLVPEQWQRINKVHTGTYVGRVGNRINYVTDTDNGNSGSPVTQIIGSPFGFEQAIGIHTNGFCPATFNSGTAIDHPGLQAFLASPQGVAVPYNSAVSKALSTTFNSDNGGSDGGSIFFDVTTGTHALTVNYLNLNINRDAATSNGTATEDDDFFNFQVYLTPDTCVGKQTNSALWTIVASGSGMPRDEDRATLGALENTFVLNGSQSYGMAIVFGNGAGHAYTNGTGSNENYSNADLSITGVSASNTHFGTVISGRVFNGSIGYNLNESTGQCAETLFAQNNFGSNGGMVYFNVATGSQPVTLTALTTNVQGVGGFNCNLDIYRRVGTFAGNEANPGAWTLVSTASGVSNAQDTPSAFGLNSAISLNANTTYGFAIQLTAIGGTGGHAYTNATGQNNTYIRGPLTITTGSASNAPFGTTIEDRVWNGSFCYGISLTQCSSALVSHQPANPTLTGFNSEPGGQEEADNFSSTQNLSITGGTFWAAYSTPATPPPSQDMIIRFFNDAGGLPGALVASRTVNNVAAQDSGLFMVPFSKPIYQFNMSFAAVALPPGTYWVSALGNQPGFTWAWARTNSTANAHAVRNGVGAWAFSSGDFALRLCGTSTPAACYPNCDNSTTAPILNVQDFACFLNAFAAGQAYANCDNSTTPPVLNVQDFACFLNAFAAGCP